MAWRTSPKPGDLSPGGLSWTGFSRQSTATGACSGSVSGDNSPAGYRTPMSSRAKPYVPQSIGAGSWTWQPPLTSSPPEEWLLNSRQAACRNRIASFEAQGDPEESMAQQIQEMQVATLSESVTRNTMQRTEKPKVGTGLRQQMRVQKLRLFHAWALYEAGKQHREDGDWDEAKKCFEAVKRMNPLPADLRKKTLDYITECKQRTKEMKHLVKLESKPADAELGNDDGQLAVPQRLQEAGPARSSSSQPQGMMMGMLVCPVMVVPVVQPSASESPLTPIRTPAALQDATDPSAPIFNEELQDNVYLRDGIQAAAARLLAARPPTDMTPRTRVPSRTPSPPTWQGFHPSLPHSWAETPHSWAETPLAHDEDVQPFDEQCDVVKTVKHTFIHFSRDLQPSSGHLRSSQGHHRRLEKCVSAPGTLLTSPFSSCAETPVSALSEAPSRDEEAVLLHGLAQCNPCAYFFNKADGCRRGNDCVFCHQCPNGEMRKRRKEKRATMRATRRLASLQHLDIAE